MASKSKKQEQESQQLVSDEESGSEYECSDSGEESDEEMEVSEESEVDEDLVVDENMSENEGEDEVNTKKEPVRAKETKKKKAEAKKNKKKASKKVTKKEKPNKKKKAIIPKSIVEDVKKNAKDGKPSKSDGVINSEKNKLDEDLTKKPLPPFEEKEDIVDMNKDETASLPLCKKVYRVSPKGATMQYTIRCDYRHTVTKVLADGKQETYGMFPTLIQSKFRIDNKRSLGKDGNEKKPWTLDFDLKELPIVINVLKQIRKNNSSFFV